MVANFPRTVPGDQRMQIEGTVRANEVMEQAVVQMLDELVRVEAALAPLRATRT